MSDFNFALQYTVKNEGGFSNDPKDPGGATNFGIIREELARWRKRSVSVQDVEGMTLDEARLIYHDWYWLVIEADKINSTEMATCAFDSGVNFGITIGSRLAQAACNHLGASLDVDGHIGTLSLQALNLTDSDQFVGEFEKLDEQRYQEIIKDHPNMQWAMNGWMNRARKLLTLKGIDHHGS